MTDNLITLKKITDTRGSLVVLEEGRDIPFAIKRCYFIYDTKSDQPRGLHAHKALQQIFFCVRGSCDIRLDDGNNKETIRMDTPATAVYVGPMIWHEMHNFSADCVFFALASAAYDESDYIRDYKEFIARAAA